MNDSPRVQLDFNLHWCPRHLAPFRDEWPEGAGVAMLRLFDAAVADPRIRRACPRDAQGRAKASALSAVLREYAPLCCLVGDERMREIYAEVGKDPP